MKMLIVTILASTMALSLWACGGEHQHVFEESWSKDDTYHWHKCEDENCSEFFGKTEHSWDEGAVVTEATADKDGQKQFTCTVCKATKTEAIKYEGGNPDQWGQAVQSSKFDNVTMVMNTLFLEGYADAEGLITNTMKFDGDKMDMDGSVDTDPANVASTKEWYLGAVMPIVTDPALFRYSEADQCYKATESITYTATVMAYEAVITAENVTVTFDADGNIAEITCKMTQVIAEGDNTVTYVLEIRFTFTDYGTTVVG